MTSEEPGGVDSTGGESPPEPGDGPFRLGDQYALERWVESELSPMSERLSEAVALQERIGYTEGVIAALHLRGLASLAADDLPAARAHHERALGLALAIGHAAAMCEAIEGLACVAAKQSEAARAAELLSLADTHRARRSLPRRHDDAECISRLYIELGDSARASAVPTTQSLEDAVNHVLGL